MSGRRARLGPALAVSALALAGCAGLGLESVFEQPDVRLTDLAVERVTFDGADLRFEFEVANPNPVRLPLGGIDYELRIDGERLLDGLDEQGMEIAASGETPVALPLTLRFSDLRRVWRSVRQPGSSRYELVADFLFDVPVLGEVRVPLRRSGDLPDLVR
ncbi:MAG TPA: LEA type 2 family protein [Thermoanaerobaculia bacterium]|nr:LEA type 2 family protein [Thermoanaerobaculia bacterium]